MITFNLGNDSPKKDRQQDIKIADLQAAVDELNTQIDAISITLGNLSASIDDKYTAQTQTLMNALTAQINSLSSALESALTTGQLTAQIANIERLMVTVSAGFVALEAETAKIESLEAEDIESDSVKADSAEIKTLSAEKAVLNEATITLLNMLSLTVQSLTADTASIEEVTAEKISTEKIETNLLNAEHIAGGAWHTPISTPDNTELLHISIPRYNGMAQLQTEDNEFNVSILNNYLVSYNQRGEYLYRIERKDESVDIYLQNVGDTINYRVLFVGSETSSTVTSELVDKTDYRQTITDFAGVLSLESVLLGVNILFCDYLPDEGEENNLYVVKTQGSYLWNESAEEFIPLMGTSWQTKILSNESKIGDLTELSTEVKTDLVSAINEVDSHADTNAANIGTISSLTTTDKTDLVSALNEVDLHADTNSANIGTLSSLTTTASADLVSAINEVDSHADTNASDISTIIGNDTGKSTREVAQEVSATVYTPQGSCLFANLPSLSASSTKVGFVYDVTDSFTTTSDFKEGAGIEVPAGTNVVVMEAESVSYDVVTPEGSENPSEEGWYELDDGDYVLSEDTVVDSGKTYYAKTTSTVKKWDLLGFNIDLSPYQKKVMDSSVSVAGTTQTTVEGAISALAAAMSTIDAVYPVGTIYQNASVDTNPSTLFGVGTWEKIEGKFLYGTATGIALGSPGGAPTVTLGMANIPKHKHSIDLSALSGSISGSTGNVSGTGTTWNHGHPIGGASELAGGGRCTVAAVNSGVTTYTNEVNLQHTHTLTGTVTLNAGTKTSSFYGGDSQGNTTAFSIIPPYVAVNIWKRTA